VPVVNPLARELVFKIVYYGPGLGGKTTSLQYVHAKTNPEHRGKMVSLATPVDRTLYFDYLPIRIPGVRHLSVRLQLFTVPGQVYYNATRKLVLTGADGIVLVADSGRDRAESNVEALENLIENLREHGRDLERVPHVIQYNKRDLEDALPEAELERSLNRHAAPAFPTVATRGDGVFEALDAIARAVLADFESRIPEGEEAARGLALPEGGLAEALRGAEIDFAGRPKTPVPPPYPQSGKVALGLPDRAPGELAARALADALPALSERSPTPTHATDRAPRGPVSERPEEDAITAPPPRAPQVPAEAQALAGPRVGGTTARSEEDVGNEPIALARPRSRPPTAAAFSLGALFAPAERALAIELEECLARGDHSGAIQRAETLVLRTLANAANQLGGLTDAPRDPALAAWLLGLEGPRYARFRALVGEARNGSAPEAAALEAYAFALEVRLARTRRGG
jgi:signal recognition particle receptor subunit beta